MSLTTSTPTSATASVPASTGRATHALVATSHRCEAEQSPSLVQPQRPVPRHALPEALPAQAPAAAGLHCAQVFIAPTQRVRPSVRLAQCASVVHSTHALATPASPPRRQCGREAIELAQSVSKLQVVVHMPTVASDDVQNWPAGQPLRLVAVAQPLMQRRVLASHTRPERESPQSESLAQPQNAVPGAGSMHA